MENQVVKEMKNEMETLRPLGCIVSNNVAASIFFVIP